jgi:hypothetical protein
MDNLNKAALKAPHLKKTAAGLTIVFLVLMALSFKFIHGEREARINLELETRASDLASRTAELLRHSVENLHAASGLTTYMRDVTYPQFNALTDHYFEADPGLLIMEWQPIVKAADRAEFEKKSTRKRIAKLSVLGAIGHRHARGSAKQSRACARLSDECTLSG